MRVTDPLRSEMQNVFAIKTMRINLMACVQGFAAKWDIGMLLNNLELFDTLAELCHGEHVGHDEQ